MGVKMNILFTICARAGSKGVKNKNVRDFVGQPLVYHTLSVIDLFIQAYKQVYDNIDIAINTDSKELLELVGKTRLEYSYITRKKELALDTSSKVDVIKDTLIECEKIKKNNYDYVIDLDLTSPLRRLEDVQQLIAKIRENNKLDIVFSVTEARRNPYFNMVKEENDCFKRVIKSDFVARQQAPKIYDMNASMYVYRSELLKRKDKVGIFDGQVSAIHMLDTGVLDIDNEEDLELMQVIAPYFYNKHKTYLAVKNNIEKLVI